MTTATIASFSQHLAAFHASLPAEERTALETVLELAERAAAHGPTDAASTAADTAQDGAADTAGFGVTPRPPTSPVTPPGVIGPPLLGSGIIAILIGL